MKTISELKIDNDFKAGEVTSSVKYFKQNNIDWNVYLPTIGKNLQRDFVWNIEQKRELIWSIIIGRHIPHCAIINIVDSNDDKKEIFQIIDGKQRLSTIFDFVDDKFTLIIDEKEYLFSELPNDYKLCINNFYFRYYLINEPYKKPLSDKFKINWFKYINFAGTPQDKEHLDSLK